MKWPTNAICLILALSTFPFSAASIADDARPGVSLYLTRVSAQETRQATLFRCKVMIDNATGKRLEVTSNFHSVFDGLELVVTDVDGKVLKQQAYTDHQSPFSPAGRKLPLARGKTEADIVFPISEFGTVGQALKVRLVGTLSGSTYNRILSTETTQLVVSKRDH